MGAITIIGYSSDDYECQANLKPKRQSKQTKLEKLYQKYKGICQLCKKTAKIEQCNIDHIIPRSKGGRNRFENLQLAHIVCNCIKSNRQCDWEPEYYINNPLYKLIK